jgi:hypothetical protein
MKMNQGKKMLFVCLSILLTASVNAQMAKDEVQLVQNIWGLEKRAIVSDYMKFTEVELTKFLPIYDKYVEEFKLLRLMLTIMLDSQMKKQMNLRNGC